MTKPITSRIHGILDYVVVVLFAVAPTLFGLTGLAATFAYLLAGVHLLMTVLTDFPLGMARVVPFRLHGMVELAVGLVLILLAFVLFEGTGRMFYASMGAVILLVWFLTDYGASRTAS